MTAAVPDPRFRDQLAAAVPEWVGLTHDEPTLLADALLSGPLAPLLAKLRAVEALCTAQGEDSYVMTYALRRALAAS